MQITIEKNIPLVNAHKSRPGEVVYPFADMEVGDSFAVPRDMGKNSQGGDRRQNLMSAVARNYAKKYNPAAKFTARIVDENTIRVWRVA